MGKGWDIVNLEQVIKHRKEFIEIDDLKKYKRCRVKLHAQGIELRDIVQGAEIKTKKQQICKTDDLLVAEIDAKIGGFGIVPTNLDGAIVSSHYFLFEINESLLDIKFLDYFIRTPAFRDQVSAQGSTNYAAIRPNDVLGYAIPLPPLEEQRRIVARIEELVGKIEEVRSLRQKALQETVALTKTTMRQIFKPNEDYQKVYLESVCAAIIDNLHSNPVYSDYGVPCIRSSDVGWGVLNLDTARRTSEEEYKRRTVRGEPIPDDIVLVREGGGTGKAAIVLEGQRFSLGQRVMMLRPDKNKVIPKFFLYQILSPPIYEDQILPRCKGSASPHLNIGTLRKFNFFLPTLPEQRRIIAYLDELQTKIDTMKRLREQAIKELDALLPSILDKAFKGEL
ncbi:type 1 restriction-modification system specificity subunit [Nostoc sp. NIES-4103]|nr:type 1 restriction-modification system specificity subunit [Nostoc sp. NIES-4103]